MHHQRCGNEAIFGDRDTFRGSSTRILKEDGVLMSLGVIHLHYGRACRLVGGVQNNDLLAGGELHVIKI